METLFLECNMTWHKTEVISVTVYNSQVMLGISLLLFLDFLLYTILSHSHNILFYLHASYQVPVLPLAENNGYRTMPQFNLMLK